MPKIKCFCCDQPATHQVYVFDLCPACYRVHIENNTKAVEQLREDLELRKKGAA